MTARMRHGVVDAVGTGTVDVQLDGVVVTAVLLDGVTLTPGDVATLIQDGRRLVAVGGRAAQLTFWKAAIGLTDISVGDFAPGPYRLDYSFTTENPGILYLYYCRSATTVEFDRHYDLGGTSVTMSVDVRGDYDGATAKFLESAWWVSPDWIRADITDEIDPVDWLTVTQTFTPDGPDGYEQRWAFTIGADTLGSPWLEFRNLSISLAA